MNIYFIGVLVSFTYIISRFVLYRVAFSKLPLKSNIEKIYFHFDYWTGSVRPLRWYDKKEFRSWSVTRIIIRLFSFTIVILLSWLGVAVAVYTESVPAYWALLKIFGKYQLIKENKFAGSRRELKRQAMKTLLIDELEENQVKEELLNWVGCNGIRREDALKLINDHVAKTKSWIEEESGKLKK